MKLTIELSEQQIEDMLISASEGCAYWARTKVALTEALKKPVKIYDAEAPTKLLGTLEPAKLRRLIITENTPGRGVLLRDLDDCIFDRESADVFVQLALFGDLVYG